MVEDFTFRAPTFNYETYWMDVEQYVGYFVPQTYSGLANLFGSLCYPKPIIYLVGVITVALLQLSKREC